MAWPHGRRVAQGFHYARRAGYLYNFRVHGDRCSRVRNEFGQLVSHGAICLFSSREFSPEMDEVTTHVDFNRWELISSGFLRNPSADVHGV